MENPTERNLRRAGFLDKYRDIIASSAKYMELDRERELEPIAKAKRDAVAAELNSNYENERAMKYRPLTREQHRLNKAARRAKRRAMNATKKPVEIADGTFDSPLLMAATGSSSQTAFEDVNGVQLVQETEDDVKEFLNSFN